MEGRKMINTTLLKKNSNPTIYCFSYSRRFKHVFLHDHCHVRPKLGDSLRAMAESMPQLFSAFGMADVGTTLLESIIGYLYGILFTAFPGVFIILLSNRLIARYVDNGSMAYLLSVPHKRSKLAGTQAFFMVACLLAMAVYVTLLILIVSEALFPGELEKAAFLRVNVGLFGLFLFFGGICFFFSCLF